jgi:hypothetical protein
MTADELKALLRSHLRTLAKRVLDAELEDNERRRIFYEGCQAEALEILDLLSRKSKEIA